MRYGKRLAVLLLAVVVLIGAAATRGFEYDEAYSVFVTSPSPRPQWPSAVFHAGDVRNVFTARAGPLSIVRALRETDVHPPLYFWTLAAWRAVVGDGLLKMRLLSVLCALGSLAAVGAIARETRIPPAAAMLLTLGSYGFAYTSVIARGFALAQLLNLVGVLVMLRAARRRGAFAGGLLAGAATFTNYLAVFTYGAALAWLLATRRRLLWAAALGFGAFLPADAWFFAAQHGSRANQFPPFRLGASLLRLAEYEIATLFGGLPLYVSVAAGRAVAGILGTAVLLLAGLIAWRWRQGGGAGRWLLAGCAIATPLGLLALGAIFDNTPIELRYLSFAAPFTALLIADALAARSDCEERSDAAISQPRDCFVALAMTGDRLARRPLLACVFIPQALAIAGFLIRAETMQPARAVATRAALLAGGSGLVVLPRGNDGIGVVGPFIAELPDRTRILLAEPTDTPQSLRARASGSPVVLALIGVDAASAATLPAMIAAFPLSERVLPPSPRARATPLR